MIGQQYVLKQSAHRLFRNNQLISCNVRIRALTTVSKNQESRVLELLQYDIPKFKIEYPKSNISESIANKIGRNLHLMPNHPLNIIKTRIESFCQEYAKKFGGFEFHIFDNENPIVNTKSCFDDLLVGKDHVSRQPSDTYYIDDNQLLRTHTSAHQTTCMSKGFQAFLCTGDVYRRDEIDSTHYPVFHQMEGVRLFNIKELIAASGEEAAAEPQKSREIYTRLVAADLQLLLSGLARHLFGETEQKMVEDSFPFTSPSFELEVLHQGRWLEVLGCGVIHRQVLVNAGLDPEEVCGWAFGLGLERLAMVLFDIPDIRLFWSADERFLKQFVQDSSGSSSGLKFIPYSKHPPCYKDVSFWLPSDNFHVNDLFEIIREVGGDLVESVQKIDEYEDKKRSRVSHAYRIVYRHMDKSLTNLEVDEIQWTVRKLIVEKLGVILR